MFGEDLKNDVMSEILASNVWSKQGFELKLNETAEVQEVDAEEVEEHSCPLCESVLEEPISDERLQEHVDYILSVINETVENDGDALDEETEDDDAAE